jgi:hypothetical protein
LKDGTIRGRIKTTVFACRNQQVNRRETMSEQANELQKLVAIASDLTLPAELRVKAIEQVGKIGTNEALRALLDLAANEKLIRDERELALKQAGTIIKSSN